MIQLIRHIHPTSSLIHCRTARMIKLGRFANHCLALSVKFAPSSQSNTASCIQHIHHMVNDIWEIETPCSYHTTTPCTFLLDNWHVTHHTPDRIDVTRFCFLFFLFFRNLMGP
eukprot:TRINITY_DN14274_c0_g4_i1.p1 TRINITY_DN14274_c0_g4~~TRINITY_DN14274_c0_g4_i1.p1  ORF type:complete len:113 (-),score=2.12 TRINITY_DN14274_c0_g4_i1:99-437(-)